MKKTICCTLFLLSIPSIANAQCSWVNPSDDACRNKFEEVLKELKQNFPKVKNTSPFYKIYELTTNKDKILCKNFLNMAENLRYFHIEPYEDKPISQSVLNTLGNRIDIYKYEHIDTENIRFTKLAPNSYLATYVVHTSIYTYYLTYKLTNEAKEIPTDDFMSLPSSIKNAEIPYYEDRPYDFYYNNSSKRFYAMASDANDWWSYDNFKGFIYELSTTENKIQPICEYDLSVKNIIPDNTQRFSELLRLYEIITGSKCCLLSSNRPFEIDKNILTRSYLLLLHPDKYRAHWSPKKNIWQFYEDWASLSPVNHMQYQKFLIELEKYGNHMGNVLKKHLNIKNEEQLNTLKYFITKVILSDIPVIYDYDEYRKQPNDFIQKIQNNTVSDIELKENLSQQYTIEQLYGDAWFVEPALFHALTYPQLLKRMIKFGYDVNVPNWYHKTPLMTAAHLNNYEAAEILLKAGADVNKKMGELLKEDLFDNYNPRTESYRVTRQDRTALMYACENTDYKLIKLLIDHGANTSAKDSLNNGIDYYINLNNKLTSQEKEKLLNLLKH